jgi:hypothetical protein
MAELSNQDLYDILPLLWNKIVNSAFTLLSFTFPDLQSSVALHDLLVFGITSS